MINSYGMSIKELLELDIMKDAKILSGKDGLGRLITKMNVMEVPDILDWVTQGEFLLTTAYSIKDDIYKLDNLITKLDEKKIAGIGIKTKRYIEEIPQSIIDKANKNNFPIIEIPYNISFSEIIMPALTEIINKQTNTLTLIYEFHNRLIETILKGGSLKEIADAIHQSIGNPVTICEKIFKTNVISSEDGFRIKIEHIFEEKFEKINFDNETNIKVIDYIDGKAITRLIIPIKVNEIIYGYINAWEMNRKITPMEITVITSSTSIITLDLLKKLSIFKIENKHRIDFFENLFSKDVEKIKKVFESKIFYDFKPNLSYTVLVVNVKKGDEYTESYLLEKMTKTIDSLILLRKEKIIYANKGNKILFLVGSENSDNQTIIENVKKFAKEIFDVIEHMHNDSISVGIGRTYNNVFELYKSYEEAIRIINYIETKDEVKYLHYDDLGIFRILSYSELRPELMKFYRDMLEPLVKYDREKGNELVETLKKYFEYRGNIKKVSDAMFTHYNTIVYRMNRIKKITNMNFENSNDYLNMQIAVKIYEMLN